MDNPPDKTTEPEPEEIQRAIGGLLREGASQTEIHELMDKINQTYFDSAQSDSIKEKLVNAMREKEAILKRPLTDKEKGDLLDEIKRQNPAA